MILLPVRCALHAQDLPHVSALNYICYGTLNHGNVWLVQSGFSQLGNKSPVVETATLWSDSGVRCIRIGNMNRLAVIGDLVAITGNRVNALQTI
jgi:hypothetical protein